MSYSIRANPFLPPWPSVAIRVLLCSLPVALLASCHEGHIQSALHPAGPASREVAALWWIMFTILTAVFLGTMMVLLLALILPKRPEVKPPGGDTRFVVVAGIVVPAFILAALLIFSLRSTLALRTPHNPAVAIHITGHQWWWHVEYPTYGIVTANEFYIPAGAPVHLLLASNDVIHSLWVPNLTTKMDLIPGKTNVFWIQADHEGTWRGQCAEFCGLQHALMALKVVALPHDQFYEWVEQRQRETPEPETALAQRGREVFFEHPAACHSCHAIRGTPADALLGPDLTHIASRLTLGAATIPNTPDLLARWIADPHEFKPGVLMPITEIPEEDLAALVEYLQTLE